MMNHIISVILKCSISEGCIDEEEIDVYSFGLECLFLKVIHYTSYIVIGIVLNSLVSLAVSACVLVPLRTKSGGYHANTRIGCYFFSCFMVIVLSIMNRMVLPNWLIIFNLLIANIVILLWAPMENENRLLENEEKVQFRKQVILLLMLIYTLLGILAWNTIGIYKYLANGVAMVAMLLLLGKTKDWFTDIK